MKKNNDIIKSSEIDRIVRMYLPCMATVELHQNHFQHKYLDHRTYTHYGVEFLGEPVLHLTPVSKLADDKILELCKVAHEQAFGDYRFSKWKVEPYKEVDGFKKISNPKAGWVFYVNESTGEVEVWDKETGNRQPYQYLMNRTDHNAVYQWYVLNRVAIPLYGHKGKTAIDLGIAVDATTVKKIEQ